MTLGNIHNNIILFIFETLILLSVLSVCLCACLSVCFLMSVNEIMTDVCHFTNLYTASLSRLRRLSVGTPPPPMGPIPAVPPGEADGYPPAAPYCPCREAAAAIAAAAEAAGWVP